MYAYPSTSVITFLHSDILWKSLQYKKPQDEEVATGSTEGLY